MSGVGAFLMSLILVLPGYATPVRRSPVSTTRVANGISRNKLQSEIKKPAVVARAATVKQSDVKKPSVVARAGTVQSVIGTGTKIKAAAENVAIDQSCAEKYNGCMDSFCMLENETGGRCICSNQIFDLDKQMEQIQKQDLQSFELLTVGVETIENDVDVSEILGDTDDADTSVLSQWTFDTDVADDVRGAKRFAQVHQTCMAYIPECDSVGNMLQMLYNQKIKSDCVAYSNHVKQSKKQSLQKADEAKKALRSAALNKITNENKYDLGQCTTEFKKCMQTTADCGNDFSRCASVVAMQSTDARAVVSRLPQTYQIKGNKTSIEISGHTYSTLMAKRTLCESVTKSCVAVADKVWDAFLKEAAVEIKNAELIAENNVRQDCIGNIADCFQKACRDKMDPNNPDGSYDMCLTRPETLLNVCRVPLNACGINTDDAKNAENSSIWNYVLARLAAMRVNSCTVAVRECLQAPDRCGTDYTQCVGLDTDTIIRMCPYDKLTGCQSVYGDTDIRGDAVYDELANIVTGIMLNIDNSMLAECQNALQESMIRVCGNTENCDSAVDELLGVGSLDYKLCEYKLDTANDMMQFGNCRADVTMISDEELGRVPGAQTDQLGPVTPLAVLLRGTIHWGSVTIDDTGRLIDTKEYFKKVDMADADKELREPIAAEFAKIQHNIDSVIASIESDAKVQFCMTGRSVQGVTDRKVQPQQARFPNLGQQMRMKIANGILQIVKDNYYEKYNALIEKQMRDFNTIAERQAVIRGENAKDARRESARKSCLSSASLSALPKSPEPPKSMWGALLVGVAVVAAAVVAMVATAGAAGVGVGLFFGVKALGLTAAAGSTMAASAAAGAAFVAGVSVAAGGVAAGVTAGVKAATNKTGANQDGQTSSELAATYTVEQFNYRETVSTNFEWDTLVCHKCVRTQVCNDIRNPMFGKKKCRTWADSVQTCSDIEF